MDRLKLRNTFFFAVLIGVILLTALIFLPYLATLSVAATIAVLVQPVHERILHSLHGNKTLAAGITTLLTAILVILPLIFIITRVTQQSIDLYTRLTSEEQAFTFNIIQSIQDYVHRFLPNASVDLTGYVESGLAWLAGGLGGVFTGTVSTIVSTLLGTVAYFYFLRDGGEFVRSAISLSPMRNAQDEKIFHRLQLTINSVIRGSLLVALLQGTSTGIGLTMFGIPSAALWGSVAVFSALIPTVGTALVFVPAVLYLILTNHFVAAAGLTAWGFVAVGLIDNFLGPYLMGKGLRMHPFFMLFAVLGGISFFGPVGILLGPLVVSLLVGLLDIYRTILHGREN